MHALTKGMLAGLLVCAWAGEGLAASLQISPVSLDMEPLQGATMIVLRNTGTLPLFGQVRVFDWSQQDGEDVLMPTSELVASPPLLEIQAGESQVVRLVRPDGQVAPHQLTYRLLIDEIPDPAAARVHGVILRMRYSVPVFVHAQRSDMERPELRWQIHQQDGQWQIQASNHSDHYAQIADLRVTDGEGKPLLSHKGLFGYVLAQRARSWAIAARTRSEGPFHVRALVNGDDVVTAVQK